MVCCHNVHGKKQHIQHTKQPTKETHRLTPVNNRIKINKSLLTPVNQFSVCNSLSKVPASESLLDRE